MMAPSCLGGVDLLSFYTPHSGNASAFRNSTSAPESRWSALRFGGYTVSMTMTLPASEMTRAYLEGDASYDGLFYLGVRTTGIFCRPTCPARKPLPKNVEYFATTREALASGYRPCK